MSRKNITKTIEATGKTMDFINDTVEKTQDTIQKIKEVVCSVLALVTLITGLFYTLPENYKNSFEIINSSFTDTIVSTWDKIYTNTLKLINPKSYYYNIYIKALDNHQREQCPVHMSYYYRDKSNFNIHKIEGSDDYIFYLNEKNTCKVIIKSDNRVEFGCEKLFMYK